MFDALQAQTHCAALGYAPTDKVYLRLISESTAEKRAMTVRELDRLSQPPGRGLYLVANPGGHTDADIKECRALFAEWDNRPKEWQAQAWREFGLPEPSLQVDTGGKSIHTYWKLSEPIAPDLWRELQADLLEFLDADRALKNPSRVMRLAGSIHQKTGQQAHIIHQQDVAYSYEELRRLIPRKQAIKAPAPSLNGKGTPAPSDGNEALYKCLAVEHRRLIDSGIGEGGRNNAAFKLASDLIGTSNWLTIQGVSSDPRRLFDQFCNRCCPPLDSRERDAVWRSAARGNPKPCLSEDKLEACLAAIQGRGAGGTPAKKVQPSRAEPEPAEPLSRSDVDAILQATNQDFDIEQLFPPGLAKAFRAKAEQLNVSPVIFAGSFLPIVAGLIPHRLKLAEDFYVPSVLWCGLVGESGTAKSAIINTLKAPLDTLQGTAYESYKTRKQEWQARKPAKGEQPDPPPARHFFFVQDTTCESLAIALESRPSVTVISDELTGFIRGMNQYKTNGKGNDRQRWLTLYDGGAIDILRKTEQLHIKRASVSLVGGIQPQVLTQIIQGDNDLSDGFWSRFYWLNLPVTKLPLTGQFQSISITPMLESLYRELANDDDPKTFRLSAGALEELNKWEARCEAAKTKEPNNFLRALYPKARQRAARIALILHCVAAAYANQTPGDYIQPETMRAAVGFTGWLLNQARLTFADSGYTDSPEAQRIAKFVTRFAGMEVTPRMVRNWWSGTQKPSAQCTKDFLQKIVSLGYGSVVQGNPDEAGYTVQVGTNGLRNGLVISPPENADEHGAEGCDGLNGLKNQDKENGQGDGKKEKNFSPLVHTYLEVPSDGALEDGLKVSPCLVHSPPPPDPSPLPPEQYNNDTQDCKGDGQLHRDWSYEIDLIQRILIECRDSPDDIQEVTLQWVKDWPQPVKDAIWQGLPKDVKQAVKAVIQNARNG